MSVELFETDLGWIGIAGHAGMVTQLALGHATSAAALKALSAKTGGERSSPWLADIAERIRRFTQGDPTDLSSIPVAKWTSTPFADRVVRHCGEIPWGDTLSYAELATLAGSPGAARAVGNVMARNPVPLIIPCHRVLGSHGRLGGYSAADGLVTKRRLLRLEGHASTAERKPLLAAK